MSTRGVYVKQNGQWVLVDLPAVNQSGTWKNVKAGFVNQNGQWNQFFPYDVTAKILIVAGGGGGGRHRRGRHPRGLLDGDRSRRDSGPAVGPGHRFLTSCRRDQRRIGGQSGCGCHDGQRLPEHSRRG